MVLNLPTPQLEDTPLVGRLALRWQATVPRRRSFRTPLPAKADSTAIQASSGRIVWSDGNPNVGVMSSRGAGIVVVPRVLEISGLGS